MQSGFADQNVQINEATPGLRIYQMEVRKALLYIGLPGTASILSSTGTSSNIVSYGLQTPFPIFVNQTGSVVGALSGDPTWFLGSGSNSQKILEKIVENPFDIFINISRVIAVR
jgi:hypothetical protein